MTKRESWLVFTYLTLEGRFVVHMVEIIAKYQEHCDALETLLATNTLSLVQLGLMVRVRNSGPFDSGILGGSCLFL